MPQATVLSPLGSILLEERAGALAAVTILPAFAGPAQSPSTALLTAAAEQLDAYFRGDINDFTLPLMPAATPRGEIHRRAIANILPGETLSYGAIARMIGSSPRAVGQACRRNPLPIIIPCHRVVAAKGGIGQYSGGNGAETKLWLLAHENRRV